MPDIFKSAAQYLRRTAKSAHGVNVGSSHAHAAISGYLGYKSKISFVADNGIHSVEDAQRIAEIQGSVESLSDVISRMKSSPLKEIPIQIVSQMIQTGLSPNCEGCGEKILDNLPVFTDDSEGDPDGHVCGWCVAIAGGDYATCTFCGSEVIYRADYINSAGECPVHEGESYMDDEERDGWDDLVENMNKDL